jgi:hypothetical protein
LQLRLKSGAAALTDQAIAAPFVAIAFPRSQGEEDAWRVEAA